VALPVEAPPMVAVGGELKATVAVAEGRRAWLSQHVGDTEHLETLDVLARTIATLAALQQVDPGAIVSDAHPGYLSHGWARGRAAALGVPHLAVQHHHAHLASLLAEHGVPSGHPVLGVVLDGTGSGGDGTIWGGELLLGSYASVRRVGHLRPVLLPGGDAAVRHPARVAVAHLVAAGVPVKGTAAAAALGDAHLRLLGRMLATGSHCVPTTSAGRLFDAVASLLDVRHAVDYEAQAAIELEALAARARARQVPARSTGKGPDGPTAAAGAPVVIDPRAWVAAAAADHAAGRPVEQAALAFHVALADGIADAVGRLRAQHAVDTVGLSGGAFANAILTELCLDRLQGGGVRVLTHQLVPPNDGGLALGQVAVAAAGGARPA
jgi:hydrogenase maturation protein HypF